MAAPGRNPETYWLTPEWTVAPSVRAVTSRTDWVARIAAAVTMVALCFSVMPDGFVWNAEPGSADAASGSLARQLQWFPLFLLAGYAVWRRRPIAAALLRDLNPFLLLFVAFATLSVLWSPYPGVTLKKLMVFYGGAVIGLAFMVAGWRPNRYADMVRAALTVMMVVSLILAVALPDLGRMPAGEAFAGNWRGATTHKNLLAALAAAGGLCWVHAWAIRRQPAWRCLAGLALALVLLIMSGGKTGLATLLVAIPIVWLVLRPPLRMPNLLSVTLVTMLIAMVGAGFAVVVAFGGVPNWQALIAPVAEMFGKDPTLTSRDRLWEMLWVHIDQHWLLGYGFDSFWLGTVGPSADIAEVLYWTPWQAHNGYMDILNETGLVGLGLTIGFVLTHLVQIWRLSLFDAENAGLHLGLTVMILLANITETSLFSGVALYWLVLLFSSLAVSRALSRRVAELAGLREPSRAWVAEGHAVPDAEHPGGDYPGTGPLGVGAGRFGE